MITKRLYEVDNQCKEAWYLFGIIPLYIRDLNVKGMPANYHIG